MKEFWMIRHAESQANAGERTNNQANTHLTESGKVQAKRLKEQLNKFKKPELMVYSKYPRTWQTLVPYHESHQDIPVEMWDVHEFSYLSQIKHENTSFKDRIMPKEEYWARNDPHYRDGDGAESYSDLLHRVERMLRMVLERKENRIWVFTHGQFMKAVLYLLMSEKLNQSKTKESPDMERFKIFMDNHNLSNCSLIRVKVDEGSYWFSFDNVWSLK